LEVPRTEEEVEEDDERVSQENASLTFTYLSIKVKDAKSNISSLFYAPQK
jgi:hypothetical protein